MAGAEGKRVKKVEGIPIEEAEKLQDIERGVVAEEMKREEKKEEKKEEKEEKKGEKENGVGGLS